MSSRLGWRRFLPGKRKNRREDHVIRATPISEAGALLREEETDPEETPVYHGQQQYVSSRAPSLSITHIVLLAIP